MQFKSHFHFISLLTGTIPQIGLFMCLKVEDTMFFVGFVEFEGKLKITLKYFQCVYR